MFHQTANPAVERTCAKNRADRSLPRVCRAWHVTMSVKVRQPGIRRAEGLGNGKGVAARRGLKEAEPKAAGR